jgi:hypothetical protein
MHTSKKKGSKKVKADWINVSGFRSLSQAHEIRRMSYIASLTLTAQTYNSISINVGLIRSLSTEWSSFTARYVEYRMLALRLHVTDQLGASQSATVIFSTDRSGVLTTPTTPAQQWAMANPKVMNLDYSVTKMPSYEAKAIDLEDQLFTPVGQTSLNTFAIILGINIPTATTAIWTYYVEAMLEFKGSQ